MLDGVLSCLVERHDWRIAAFAILACVFSLGIALLLSERARRLSPRARRAYTLSAPLVGGLGVWTTHFIAMLAYDVGVEVRLQCRVVRLGSEQVRQHRAGVEQTGGEHRSDQQPAEVRRHLRPRGFRAGFGAQVALASDPRHAEEW